MNSTILLLCSLPDLAEVESNDLVKSNPLSRAWVGGRERDFEEASHVAPHQVAVEAAEPEVSAPEGLGIDSSAEEMVGSGDIRRLSSDLEVPYCLQPEPRLHALILSIEVDCPDTRLIALHLHWIVG